MAEPGRLISFRSDRLGARLISLVNTMRLAEDYGIGFAAHWPFAVDVTAVFNDPTELLQEDFVDAHFIGREEWLACKKRMQRIGDVIRQGPEFLTASVAAGENVSIDQAFGINVLLGEDEAEVKPRFLAALARVPFADALLGPIETVSAALEGATAYHIRRGDLTEGLRAMNKPWPHKVVPDEFYEQHMENELGDGATGAVLFSDDAGVLEHYTNTFPALRTIHDMIDLGGLTEAQRDFIELYAMSRSAKIIAPERSAFSSTAVDLGSAVKKAVTEDMTPELRAAAHERLLVRLRDRPESFPGEGEIGQSLAHIGPYLEAEGRSKEAADLFAARIRTGLNIAFIYPDAMRLQHLVGDTDGVLDVARAMQDRHVHHTRYFVDAEIEHGYAHMRQGDMHKGVHHVTNAFWHGPNVGSSRLLVPALVETGVLNAHNFLPVSRVQLNLHRRRGPLKHLVTRYPEIFKMPGVGVPTSLATVDTAVWDWSPLMRSASIAADVKKGTVGRIREVLDGASTPPELELERASLQAVLRGFDGEMDAAIVMLSGLAERHPDDMMVWKRLSHAHWYARDFEAAAEAAEQAVRAAPDVPVIHAWAGMIQIRLRNWDPAVSHLTRADAAGLGFASIPAFLAQALLGAGRADEAIAAIDRAMTLAPMEPDFAMTRADALTRVGRLPDAAEALWQMVERERAPAKLFAQLIEVATKMQDAAAIDRIIATVQERFPDHPMTAKLVARHVA